MNPPTSPGVSGPNVVIEEEAQQEFEEIAGRVRELCRCQSGSRYLQRQLTKGHPQVASLILKEVFVTYSLTIHSTLQNSISFKTTIDLKFYYNF